MFLKFLGMQKIRQLCSQKSPENDFLMHVYKNAFTTTEFGSFAQTKAHDILNINHIQNISCQLSLLKCERQSYEYLVPPHKEKCFTDAEMSCLNDMYML